MLVSAALAASTAPVKRPLLIDTVADWRVWSSTSLTVAAGDSVSGAAFSLQEALAAKLLSTGALSAATMLRVVVWVVVLLSVPSLITHGIVRLVSVPKVVGLSLVET